MNRQVGIANIENHTFILPVPSLRLANEAALCDSYSRKQNPLFFFLSSGELYIITSIKPAEKRMSFMKHPHKTQTEKGEKYLESKCFYALKNL